MTNKDEQILAIMDMMIAGNSAILPDEAASIKLEKAIEDVCIKWALNVNMMRREIKEKGE